MDIDRLHKPAMLVLLILIALLALTKAGWGLYGSRIANQFQHDKQAFMDFEGEEGTAKLMELSARFESVQREKASSDAGLGAVMIALALLLLLERGIFGWWIHRSLQQMSLKSNQIMISPWQGVAFYGIPLLNLALCPKVLNELAMKSLPVAQWKQYDPRPVLYWWVATAVAAPLWLFNPANFHPSPETLAIAWWKIALFVLTLIPLGTALFLEFQLVRTLPDQVARMVPIIPVKPLATAAIPAIPSPTGTVPPAKE
jgi:hypothetical protein